MDIARTAFRALHQFWNWPLATDHIFMADGRFGCEADMAGPAAGSTRSLVTQLRHSTIEVIRSTRMLAEHVE